MRKIKLLSYLAIACLCMAGCSNSETESIEVQVQEAVIDNITEDVINITTDAGEKIEIDTEGCTRFCDGCSNTLGNFSNLCEKFKQCRTFQYGDCDSACIWQCADFGVGTVII